MSLRFHLQINPSSGVPVYRQIMDQVRYYVAAGQLKPGDQLPSIRELAASLRVNPTTIVKAYSELQHGGDIDMQHGKGAFIAQSSCPKTKADIEREFRRLVVPLAATAVQMGLPARIAAGFLQDEMHKLTQDTPT